MAVKPIIDRQKLYELLTTVPRGHVITYAQLAELLGNRQWARTVGSALHKNPDGERYPCYKVVNSKGRLSRRYAFGGIDEQRHRLQAEGITVDKDTVDLNRYGVNFHGV